MTHYSITSIRLLIIRSVRVEGQPLYILYMLKFQQSHERMQCKKVATGQIPLYAISVSASLFDHASIGEVYDVLSG